MRDTAGAEILGDREDKEDRDRLLDQVLWAAAVELRDTAVMPQTILTLSPGTCSPDRKHWEANCSNKCLMRSAPTWELGSSEQDSSVWRMNNSALADTRSSSRARLSTWTTSGGSWWMLTTSPRLWTSRSVRNHSSLISTLTRMDRVCMLEARVRIHQWLLVNKSTPSTNCCLSPATSWVWRWTSSDCHQPALATSLRVEEGDLNFL